MPVGRIGSVRPNKRRSSESSSSSVSSAASKGGSKQVLVVRLVPVALVNSVEEGKAYIKERLGGAPGALITPAGACPLKPSKKELEALHAFQLQRDASTLASLQQPPKPKADKPKADKADKADKPKADKPKADKKNAGRVK